MTGRSHKAIGVAVGAAFTIYGIRSGHPEAALALVSAPLAAMLPDIDHSGSKIGQFRKKAVNMAVTVTGIALVAAAWYYSAYIIENYRTLLTMLLGVIAPIGILLFLSQTKWVKNSIRFATKHRGIMHTLLIPAVLLFAAQFAAGVYFMILVYGFVAGYISHIFADILTKRGCPVLFPLTTKSINLTGIRTGSYAEKVLVIVLIAVIVAVPFLWNI